MWSLPSRALSTFEAVLTYKVYKCKVFTRKPSRQQQNLKVNSHIPQHKTEQTVDKTEKVEYIGEGIDRLITLDLRARGVIYRLYEAARKLINNRPLALTAAQRITNTVDVGDYVIITTGFILPPNYVQESDGPPGAIALARALNLAFKAKPILIIEEKSKEILLAALNAAGMRNVAIEELAKKYAEYAVAIMSFPFEFDKAEEKAEEILKKYNPSLIIAIEKPGKNSKGEYHTMKGLNISQFHMKIEPLIDKANRQGVLTIGIGDGGNEIGMGNIKDTVEKYVPYAKVCPVSYTHLTLPTKA